MSKVDNILLDFSAKKIQKFFIFINIIKKHKIFLNNFSKAQINLKESIIRQKEIDQKDKSEDNIDIDIVDFSKFSKLIRQKEVIQSTKDLINSFNLSKKSSIENQNTNISLEPKVLLTSFLILFFQNDLVGDPKNRNQVDNSLIDWVNLFTEKIANFNEKNSNISNKINETILLFENFQIVFDQWKNYDKNRLIESIIVSYNNRCEHIEMIKNNEIPNDFKPQAEENKNTIFKNLDNESKNEMLKTLEEQKNDLLKQIKLTDPSIDIEYIKENSSLIIQKMNESFEKINNEVSKTMKKAYYDMLCEEINSGNMLPIFELMKEINNRLLILIPQKIKNSFEQKFDQNKIINLLTDYVWSQELIDQLDLFIDTIFMVGAPADDEEMKNWKNYIMSLTKDNFSNNLPLILLETQEKIDRVFSLINQLNKT